MTAGVQQFVVRPQAFAPRCQRSLRLFDNDQNRQAASVTSHGYSLNSLQVTIKPQVKAKTHRYVALSCPLPYLERLDLKWQPFLQHCMLIYSLCGINSFERILFSNEFVSPWKPNLQPFERCPHPDKCFVLACEFGSKSSEWNSSRGHVRIVRYSWRKRFILPLPQMKMLSIKMCLHGGKVESLLL